jgi:hypothetical protein
MNLVSLVANATSPLRNVTQILKAHSLGFPFQIRVSRTRGCSSRLPKTKPSSSSAASVNQGSGSLPAPPLSPPGQPSRLALCGRLLVGVEFSLAVDIVADGAKPSLQEPEETSLVQSAVVKCVFGEVQHSLNSPNSSTHRHQLPGRRGATYIASGFGFALSCFAQSSLQTS